jgi:hypothetical protein
MPAYVIPPGDVTPIIGPFTDHTQATAWVLGQSWWDEAEVRDLVSSADFETLMAGAAEPPPD